MACPDGIWHVETYFALMSSCPMNWDTEAIHTWISMSFYNIKYHLAVSHQVMNNATQYPWVVRIHNAGTI